jgi:hypothetical protein
VVRVDISKKWKFITKDGLRADNMPAVLVYFEGEYHVYDGTNRNNTDEILHLINKFINPIVTLDTEEELQAFLNLENEFVEKNKFFEKKPVLLGNIYKQRKPKTRVLAFLMDIDDFADEIDTLKQTARYSAKRDELRVGMVLDKKIIRKYKANHGTLWFPEGSFSTLVLKRCDGRIFSHDLLEGAPQNGFAFWMNK